MPENTKEKTGPFRYLIRAIAVSALLAALAVSVAFISRFLCIPDSQSLDEARILMLHKEPADSIDVLLIGSSATYSGYSAAYAYEKYGFTSYPYAIKGATCTLWKPALKDTLRTQRPKLVVVDVFGGGYDRELIETRSSQLYNLMNAVPFSEDKIKTAREISSNLNNVSAASMVFPFIKCHTNVPANLKHIRRRIDVERSGPSPLKGIETKSRCRDLADIDESSFSSDTVPLDDRTEALIRDFIEYCRSENIDMLFIKFPTVLTEQDPDELLVNLRANRILEIAGEYGCGTLNMQKLFHEIGLKEQVDYYNHGHPNVRGQKKITDYLGRYIRDEMHVGPSSLDDSVRAEWDESIEYYKAFVRLAEELMRQKKHVTFGDTPAVVRDLKRILDGEDIEKIAEKYHSDK